MNLSKKIIECTKQFQTPFLLVDKNRIVSNYKRIKNSIDHVEVFYAVKANDHSEVSKVLYKAGASFEISSLTELKILKKLGVPSSKIMCLNPIKSPEFLIEMKKLGVDIMAYDSKYEVDKIAEFAPGSKVVIRITVDNEGSEWPLTKKFGVDVVEALPLLLYAKQKGLDPIGITFHVGSQCLNKNNWVSALYVCDDIWNQAKSHGIDLYLLSLGGGIPTQHLKKIPSVQEIGDVINTTINKNFKTNRNKLRVTIEPGRGLIGDTAIMVTSVVGKAKRGKEDWIYFDVGVFNGFMETIQGFLYEMTTEKKGKRKRVTIAGPSCDCVDIPFNDVLLPEVELNDRVYILNAGAYTTVYASAFNGFAIPKVYFLNS